MSVRNHLASVVDDLSFNAAISTNLVKGSTATTAYLYPEDPGGSLSIRSIAQYVKGIVPFGTGCNS